MLYMCPQRNFSCGSVCVSSVCVSVLCAFVFDCVCSIIVCVCVCVCVCVLKYSFSCTLAPASVRAGHPEGFVQLNPLLKLADYKPLDTYPAHYD